MVSRRFLFLITDQAADDEGFAFQKTNIRIRRSACNPVIVEL